MRKGKKESKPKKDEKPTIKYSLQEQLAKNAEDVDQIKISLIKPSINKISNETFENKRPNKFDTQNDKSNEVSDDTEYNGYSNDLSNEQNYVINSDEKEFNKNNKKKNHKKRQGPFKSTAEDFKIKYKTELCKYYEINGFCKYGDNCAYAHGKENLRSKITNTTAYRTKKCVQFFQNGYCPYGNRCQFAHQITSNIINNPYDKKMTYTKMLEIISKQENIENIKGLVMKSRLSVFKEIANDNKDIKNTLLDDIKNIYKEGIIERIDN